jgi:glutamine synthetase
MEGVKKKTEPPEPVTENVFHLTPKEMKTRGIEVLPEHLGEAVDYFEEDPVMKEALGDYLHSNLVALKRKEYDDYLSFTGVEWAASRPKITSWEYDRYLTRC